MILKILQSKDPKLRQISKPVQAVDEAPSTLRSGYLLPMLRREQNPSEAENSSHSFLRPRSGFSAKGDKKIKDLIKDLKDTLYAQKDPEGVGLAAPQVGKNIRVFVMRLNSRFWTIINPEILSVENISKARKSKRKSPGIMEGCLSLPNYYGPIKRSVKLSLRYKNEEGEEKTETFEGILAQIVEHEIDHLNGVLFIDRLLEQKKPLYLLKGEKWEEVELI